MARINCDPYESRTHLKALKAPDPADRRTDHFHISSANQFNSY